MRNTSLGLFFGVSLAALAGCSEEAKEADVPEEAESADANGDGKISRAEAEKPLKQLIDTELQPGLWRIKSEETRDEEDGKETRTRREDLVVCITRDNMEDMVDRFLLLNSGEELLRFPDESTEFTELKVSKSSYLIETKGVQSGRNAEVSLSGEVSETSIKVEAEGTRGDDKRTLSMNAERTGFCEEGEPEFPMDYDEWKNGGAEEAAEEAVEETESAVEAAEDAACAAAEDYDYDYAEEGTECEAAECEAAE